jgi:hypothetical protein
MGQNQQPCRPGDDEIGKRRGADDQNGESRLRFFYAIFQPAWFLFPLRVQG